MTSQAVRSAAARPDLNHRDPEFDAMFSETRTRLLSVYDETAIGWHAYLLGGSGTLAVEAMITSLVSDGPVLVLENGYYSSRIREIFEIHRIPYKALSHGWLEPWNFAEIESELRIGYEAVIGVHNETTIGRLNDIGRLGELCRVFNAKCLIDGMSSFGADTIDFTTIDAVCASGNKCLHSIPGVAFVLVREALTAGMAHVARRSYYMSLPMYAGNSPPLTPPIPALAALLQALTEMPPGGARVRGEDYRRKAEFVRENLCCLGFRTPIPSEDMSCSVTTVSLPEGFNFEEWFRRNLDAGFVLYDCKGVLHDRYFQVSNMGELTIAQLEAWIAVVRGILGR